MGFCCEPGGPETGGVGVAVDPTGGPETGGPETGSLVSHRVPVTKICSY